MQHSMTVSSDAEAWLLLNGPAGQHAKITPALSSSGLVLQIRQQIHGSDILHQFCGKVTYLSPLPTYIPTYLPLTVLE